MEKASRRKFMALGVALLGAGTVGKRAVGEVQEAQSTPPEPPLDVHDLSIEDISLNVYPYNSNDWDADVRIAVSNSSRRGYHVNIPVHIEDGEGNQQDKSKTFTFSIDPEGYFEGEKTWNARNSKVKGGEKVVVEEVSVKSRRLIKSEHEDVTHNSQEVIEDEN